MGMHFRESEEKITIGMIVAGIIIIGILLTSLIVYLLNVNSSKVNDSVLQNTQISKLENTDEFEDYFFSVCTADYKKMAENMVNLKRAVDSAKKMTIKKHGYSLDIEIGDNAYICAGEINIPDGELFFAPKLTGVNGTILFDTPCLFRNSTIS